MMVDELELEKWDPDDMDGLWKQGEISAKLPCPHSSMPREGLLGAR